MARGQTPLQSGLAVTQDFGVGSVHSKMLLSWLFLFLNNSIQPRFIGIFELILSAYDQITLVLGLAQRPVRHQWGVHPIAPAWF